jgi:hypothetical protein
MPSYRYRFISGGHADALLYAEASSAFFSAVTDLHDCHREPLAIARDGQPWADRAAIDRCYAACRAELAVDRWQVPSLLQRLAAREGGTRGE